MHHCEQASHSFATQAKVGNLHVIYRENSNYMSATHPEPEAVNPSLLCSQGNAPCSSLKNMCNAFENPAAEVW